MSNFTALYDACVLYPAPLRDLLMRLAMTGLFRARWTNQIHEEWITALLKNRSDLTREKLDRTRELMNRHVLDCLVEGYEYLIDAIELPDPSDRHVLAAAIKANAGVIVTFNETDFPIEELKGHGIEAQHPDLFITHLIDLNAGVVCSAVKSQRAALRNPPKGVREFLDTLESAQLVETCYRLSDFRDVI